MRIALVAGELSGDILGAAIVRSLKQRYPQAQIYGVTGPRMEAAGCQGIASIDVLSVMGIAEVIPALPRLFRLRAELLRRFLQDRPDVVIGIDAPDFNLGLERRLRERGLKTVHVVSPSVWAWRQGRVKTIARSVDRMLCLFPFEPKFYAEHGVPADYIGHPLADELDDAVTPAAARADLGLPAAGPLVAILPGSRGSELKYLGEPFAQAARLLAQQHPGIRFVTPVAKPKLRAGLEQVIREHAPGLDWTVVEGRSRECMRAADTVLLASGTATLECLLLGRPMVVAYRGSPLTAWLMLKAGLLKTRYVSLPNLLSAEATVTELLQDAATPERMAEEVSLLLADGEPRRRQLAQFHAVRTELRRDAAGRAADAIAGLLA
ncbi:lipid-A-disaccharide synthase [Solimonas sp. SE-A11]|uniref:lipid-A-disaccharide synthase n=1 Tax=Solimonas sp. SE-A11 TaxID=3054954 RepID=UPI00259CD923|nr:lipid-A-disaccharide synthase [Solimonas sp. SE-A11]MDM4770952.1 lipid-A-disaccharide synthase [Solimonas sp. SE-A11]